MLNIFKKRKLDIDRLIADSLESLQTVNQEHKKNWQLGRERSWKVDESTGRITFTFTDGTEVVAPVQVIGTYNPAIQQFTWAWNHPAVRTEMQQHAARVREFAEEHDCTALMSQQTSCSEKRAWEYTALAMLLSEANGAYRAQIAPDTFVFMTFGQVEIFTTI